MSAKCHKQTSGRSDVTPLRRAGLGERCGFMSKYLPKWEGK